MSTVDEVPSFGREPLKPAQSEEDFSHRSFPVHRGIHDKADAVRPAAVSQADRGAGGDDPARGGEAKAGAAASLARSTRAAAWDFFRRRWRIAGSGSAASTGARRT